MSDIHKTNLETVHNTLEFYDPESETITIGTAALVTQGIEVPYLLHDVDVLAKFSFIKSLKTAMYRDFLNDTTSFAASNAEDYGFSADLRIMLEPNANHPISKHLLPFQAFTDMHDNKHTTSYEDVKETAIVHPETGRMFMPVDAVKKWKQAVGRPKDLELLKLIH